MYVAASLILTSNQAVDKNSKLFLLKADLQFGKVEIL